MGNKLHYDFVGYCKIPYKNGASSKYLQPMSHKQKVIGR